MGRTDLARFRKTATSITPPAAFPCNLRHLLCHSDSHPYPAAVHAIRSVHDASSQRAQVSAIKLLGVILFDTHQSSHPTACPCLLPGTVNRSCSRDDQLSCHLTVPILSAFLFSAPDAIPGLISTSLRALLRVWPVNICLVNDAFESFFESLEDIPNHLEIRQQQHKQDCYEKEFVTSLACKVNTAAVMLSENESKKIIFSHPTRVAAILIAACHLTDLFILTSTSGTTTGVLVDVDTNLIEGACDSSMKAIQDIVNEFYTQNTLSHSGDSALKKSSLIAKSVDCCHRLLCLESAPRSCSLACAVTLVTGHVLLNCDHTNIDDLVHTLRDDILRKVTNYPSFSQLSILRALMEAHVAEPALSQLLFPKTSFDLNPSNAKTIFSMLISQTSASSDVHFRYLAMEAVISCVRRVPQGDVLNDVCRDAVLSLVYQRWEEPFAGVTSQMRDTMDALVATDGKRSESLDFWRSMALSLAQGDWRCKGMYAPLGVLVRRIGAQTLLDAHPDCQAIAMYAMASDSRLTKAVADWLDAFWDVLKAECQFNVDTFVELTAPHLVDALLQPRNQTLRERVAEHVLPVYMRSEDKQNIANIGRALLSWLSSSSSYSSSSSLPSERSAKSGLHSAAFVRGSVMVMAVARRKGVSSIVDFVDENVQKLLITALESTEDDLRAAAFDVVVSSGVPTEPITQAEFNIILSYLPIALMPGGTPADRSRFRHSMRRLLERVSICKKAAVEGTGGWWSRQRKTRTRNRPLDCSASKMAPNDLEVERVALLARIDDFIKRCVGILIASSFPGAGFSRRTSALEIIQLLVTNLGADALLSAASDQSHSCLAALTAGLLDEWERPRRASMQVLQALPSPLSGLSTISETVLLMKRVRLMLDCPRQKEVDSAASLCHIIFQKVVLCSSKIEGSVDGGLDVVNGLLRCFNNETRNLVNGNSFSTDSKSTSHAILYAIGILRSVDDRISLAKKDLMLACAKGLFHGHFLLLRYLVQDFPWKGDVTESTRKPLAHFIHQFVQLARRCIDIALDGVSFEKQSDTAFGNITSSNASDDDQNLNGAAFHTTGNRDAIFLQHGKQLESTSCFLSAKEICVALGVLSNQAPLDEGLDSQHDGSGNKGSNFLDQSSIASIGDLFISVLVGTRHWGVIDGASEGFQLLCERLLSSSSLNLQALPKKWAMDILSRALSGELYVLRRSAGVPWLICAVVNAEASVNRKSHESPILNAITSVLLDHMHSANTRERNQQRSNGVMGKLAEESMSHALNLLRALFLNSNIGSNTLKYLESATICCIDAFCSSSWLVRNSTLMLYSALIRRGIGVCREHKEEDTFISAIRSHMMSSTSVSKTEAKVSTSSSFKAAGGTSATLEGTRRLSGTTAFQFFSRYPRLHPFLLDHLETAVQASERHGDHPVLFPTLYLLSCLSPNTNEDPSTRMSMSKFVNVIETCTHWKSDYVRRAAAAAHVALIDDCDQIPGIVRDILMKLPEEPSTTNLRRINHIHPLNGFNNSEKSIKSPAQRKVSLEQNWLHGELLTVTAILQNTDDVMSPACKAKLVDTLASILPRISWIAIERSKNPCSITRGCMIDLVSLSYRLAIDQGWEAVLKFGDDMAKKIAADDSLAFGSLSQIGFSAFRIKALKFYGAVLTRMYRLGQYNLREALESLCVRIESVAEDEKGLVGCMEACSELLSSSQKQELKAVISSNVLDRLWAVAVGKFYDERRLEPLVASLNLIMSLLDSGLKTNFECTISLVFQLAEEDTCIDVQERAIVILGQLVGLGYFNKQSISRWMNLIINERGSLAPSVRMAICSSICKSFTRTQPTLREFIVDGYLTLARMLEDDSTEVRQHALGIAHQLLIATEMNPSELKCHFLPTLMKIFHMLGISHGDSLALFMQLNALIATSEQDVLMSVLIRRISQNKDIQQQLLEPQSTVKTGPFTNGVDTHDEINELRLFKLEQVCGDGETVLKMHLITWCYVQILRRSGKSVDAVLLQEISAMVQGLTAELECAVDAVVKSAYSREDLMIGGGMFGNEGFLIIERQILRIYLGLWCMLCSGISLGDKNFSELGSRLQSLSSTWGSSFNPVLSKSLQGLVDFSNDTRCFENRQIDDGRILFLLSLKDLQ